MDVPFVHGAEILGEDGNSGGGGIPMAGDGIFTRAKRNDGNAICWCGGYFFAINPDAFGVVTGDMYFGATTGGDAHIELEQITFDFPAGFVGAKL